MEKYPLVRQDQLDTSQAENTIKMKKGGLVRQDQNKAFWSFFFFTTVYIVKHTGRSIMQ